MTPNGSRKAREKKRDVPRAAPFHFNRRTSGLLLHVTSLPGRHGSGDLGREAANFLDFCRDAGQTWWQMLPVGPPGGPPGNSPYSSYSAAAGSPYLIALDDLGQSALGLLSARELAPPAGADDRRVNFRVVHAFREDRLRLAFRRFREGKGPGYLRAAVERFAAAERAWLDDFALFCALKERSGGAPWDTWDRPLRQRSPAALARAADELADRIDFHRFVQYEFDSQWRRLRDVATMRGVGLIGDVPIYVIHDSVDVWCNPQLFRLDRSGRPTHVSGVPPDAFSDEGQRWGHPQYDWGAHARENFRWWVSRFERTFRLFDAVRIDHFLGFNRVWSIPASSPTAKGGKWVQSPGRALFNVLRRELGERPVIAEDLGALTPEAAALRDEFNFPGMRVMHFGFGGGGGDPYHRPHSYPPASVAYTGTHDNDTTTGWFKQLRPAAARRDVLHYAGATPDRIHLDLVRAVMASAAGTTVVPVQDLLGLDNRARMNMPGKAEGNWGWRLPPRALTPALAKELRCLTDLTGRLPT